MTTVYRRDTAPDGHGDERGGEAVSSSGKPVGLVERLPVRARTGLFLGVLVVALAALFTPGPVGALLVAAIVVALSLLMTRTWVVTAPRTRMMRLMILLVFAVLAAYKLTH